MITINSITKNIRNKYVKTGITKNLSHALKMYIENDATEEEKELIKQPYVHAMTPNIEERKFLSPPQCDECGSYMTYGGSARDKDGCLHPSSWICYCGMIYYSEKTLEEWREILK